MYTYNQKESAENTNAHNEEIIQHKQHIQSKRREKVLKKHG